MRAMDVTIVKYRSHHKVVHTDHESVLRSDQLATHLNGKGVKIALRIPYEHEKTAERWRRRSANCHTIYHPIYTTI